MRPLPMPPEAFGIIALVQSRKAGHKNGFALAAIIISVVLGIIGIIVAIVIISSIAAATGDITQQFLENCAPGGSGYIEYMGEQIPCEQVDQGQLD